jgi:antitoxin MazE
MKTEIQRWGNSLAIRIPRPFAQETHLEHGSPVDLSLDSGRLIIVPVRPREYELEDFISQISDANIHETVDSGVSVGSEVW